MSRIPRGAAVITGASSGLGQEIARQLPHTTPLVLTGRNASALETLASELRGSADGVDRAVETVAGDLAEEATVERLVQSSVRLGGATLLVNAAGAGVFGAVSGAPATRAATVNRVNIDGFTLVTARFAALMVSAGRGVICTVASVGAFFPGPLVAEYYAAKAYQLSYALALDRETAAGGVRSIVVCPGPFRSAFHARTGLDATALYRNRRLPDAESIARFTLRSIGRRRAVSAPGLFLPAGLYLQALLPRTLVARAVHRLQTRRAGNSQYGRRAPRPPTT